MKKTNRVELNESQLRRIIKETVHNILYNNVDAFYDEEDSEGNVGQPGQVRSYDLGNGWYIDNLKQEAEEEGIPLEEYLETWFREVNDGTMQFTWETLGSGYGYHGDEICSFENKITGGEVVFIDVYDQIMCHEYAPRN